MAWQDDPVVNATAPQAPAVSDNTRRFLDFLAKAEGADYNVITGGGRFDDFSKHPGVVGMVTKQGPSTAAGRYQITRSTYNDVAPKLGITDFSPESQDRIAIELIRRGGALQDVESGNYGAAINKLGGTWASLPSSPYAGHPRRSTEWVNKAMMSLFPSAQAGQGNPTQLPTINVSSQGAPMASTARGGWMDDPVVEAPAPATRSGGSWMNDPVVGESRTATLPDINVPSASPKAPARNLTNDSLYKDSQWLANARQLYKETEGKAFSGDDKAAADWLKNYMGQFNWNLASTAKTAYDASNFSDAGKKALLQSMQDYESLPVSLEGTGRALKGIFTDPTTYLGLGVGSVLTKTAGKQALAEGTKLALQKGIEEAAQKSIASRALRAVTPSAVTAEGAAIAGANNLATQAAKINAGGQEGVNAGELATNVALGGAAGKAVNTLVNRVTGRPALEAFGRRAGSEGNARYDAEIIQRLGEVVDDPVRFINTAPDKVSAQTINQAVTNSFLQPVKDTLASLPKDAQPSNIKELRGALQNWRGLTEAERNALRGNPYGDAVADAVEKAVRSQSLTAAQPAVGGLAGTLARLGVTAAPSAVSAATGLPVVISTDILKSVTNKLGGRQTREEVAKTLLEGRKTAETVSGILGQSPATTNLQNLQQVAQRAQAQAQARAQAQAQAQAAQAAQNQATRLGVLQQTRMPLGGAFQELLQGGRANTNLASRDAIDALRLLKRQGGPVGDAATEILASRPVSNESTFYGLQNALRGLQERGVISGQPGALSAASSGIRNPISYAEAVRTAGEAANLARASAPNKELAQFATKVAGTKTPADKVKLLQDRLAKTSDPAEVSYLTNFIEPLTRFGAK